MYARAKIQSIQKSVQQKSKAPSQCILHRSKWLFIIFYVLLCLWYVHNNIYVMCMCVYVYRCRYRQMSGRMDG